MNTSRFASRLVCLALCTAISARAQLRQIDGTLGGEFEQQRYAFGGMGTQVSYLREVATLGVSGHVYSRNLAEFRIQTRLMNSNAISNYSGARLKQHDSYFSYYDASINFFSVSRHPLTLFARKDKVSNEVAGGLVPTVNNEFISTSFGGRFSVPFNNGSLPTATLSYDRNHNVGVDPGRPVDQLYQNMQVSLSMSLPKTTALQVDVLQRERNEGVAQGTVITRELRFSGSSYPSERTQFSAAVNYLREARLDLVNGNTRWNWQPAGELNNQFTGTFYLNRTPGGSYGDITVRNHLDVGLSTAWRGLMIVSHSEGRSNISAANTIPLRATDVLGGMSFRKAYDRVQPMLNSQFGYRRSTGVRLQEVVHGMISAGFETRGFTFGQVSVANQVRVNNIHDVHRQTLLENMLTGTVETTVVPAMFLRMNGTYTVTKDIDDGIPRRDVTGAVNATYQWSQGIPFFLTLSYGLDRVRRERYSNSMQRYAAELLIPSLLPQLSLQASLAQVRNDLLQRSEYRYYAILTYNWRAVSLAARWDMSSYESIRRSAILVTLQRPFTISLY